MPVKTNAPVLVLALMSILLVGGVPPPQISNESETSYYVKADDIPLERRLVPLRNRPMMSLPSEFQFNGQWQRPRLCGPNSLYVLLRLKGFDVTHADVASRFHIGEEGVSLQDISDVASNFGLSHRLEKIDDVALMKVKPPFIVHELVRKNLKDKSTDVGHFYVLVGTSPAGDPMIIDGVSGLSEETTQERLARAFTGYILIPNEPVWEWFLWQGVYGLAWACAALLLAFLYFYWRAKKAIKP